MMGYCSECESSISSVRFSCDQRQYGTSMLNNSGRLRNNFDDSGDCYDFVYACPECDTEWSEHEAIEALNAVDPHDDDDYDYSEDDNREEAPSSSWTTQPADKWTVNSNGVSIG